MPGGIDLGKAREMFSRELGCGDASDSDSVLDKITIAIEYLLVHGGGDILKEWIIPIHSGKITLPRDLEVPIKYKFSNTPNTGFGTVFSPYYSYGSEGLQDCCGYFNWNPKIEVKANSVSTQHPMPKCGGRIFATTCNEQDVGKKIMVPGEYNKMRSAPHHYGEKTAGELLTIYHEDDENKKYSSWYFHKVLPGVVKSLTCDYVQLWSIDDDDNICLLSQYHPDEEIIQYKQIELYSCNSGGCHTGSCLYILGRVNPHIRYLRDEEILPIHSLGMLELLAQRARYSESGNFEEVRATESRIFDLIKKTVSYQQEANRSLSYKISGSGGTLTNM